jgi:precorrin-6A synthase
MQRKHANMKQVLVIGIGAGNPEYVTVEAMNALNASDVIFLLDKGERKADLSRLRKDVCERYITAPAPRIVEVSSPERDSAESYAQGVAGWHAEKAAIFARLIRDELAEGERGAFLVWGDPSLYDSTIRILQQVQASEPQLFEYEVIPGISSLHALAARHKIALNAIGQSVLITTGRKLAEGGLPDVDAVVVLLDGGPGLDAIASRDGKIYWGAYLGTPDEILIAGEIREVIDEIRRVRQQERVRKGWIMDTYLLRRPLAAG